MIDVPDKLRHRATVTNELRRAIMADGGPGRSYLEIGVDVGYTIIALSNAFDKLTGFDINEQKLLAARKNIERFQVNNITLLKTTLQEYDAPFSADVVLHDASHEFADVRDDITAILKLNTKETFVLYVHDWGLRNAGVKEAVKYHFGENVTLCGMKSGWNYGSDIDWEAVRIVVDRKSL